MAFQDLDEALKTLGYGDCFDYTRETGFQLTGHYWTKRRPGPRPSTRKSISRSRLGTRTKRDASDGRVGKLDRGDLRARIFELLALHHSRREVAEELGISRQTVARAEGKGWAKDPRVGLPRVLRGTG